MNSLDVHWLSPVTFRNDQGKQFMDLSAPHRVDFYYFAFFTMSYMHAYLFTLLSNVSIFCYYNCSLESSILKLYSLFSFFSVYYIKIKTILKCKKYQFNINQPCSTINMQKLHGWVMLLWRGITLTITQLPESVSVKTIL